MFNEDLSLIIKSIFEFGNKHKNFFMGLIILTTLFILYKILTKMVKKYLSVKNFQEENAAKFLILWRYLWMGLAIILLMVSFSGSFSALGVSAAFIGMILGWSLQAPVTGIAAWLMIIVKRPFKIGDRVIISGITGDVIDITLMHILLNQVGGTTGGEEKSGRSVMIPTAILFQQIIYNYNFGSKYILDEVSVLLVYGSDLKKAEELLIDAAKTVTEEIIKDCGQEPYIRSELADNGIRLRLMYQTLVKERQKISSDIINKIINGIEKSDNVEFTFPRVQLIST